ncbi:hypothetical protein ILP92_05040 [Maribius pontilimi]|uniref:Uncharacterized protein n=1 Tax=Palleronia pontilimi TaxID=1964209 RepID=A0A934MBV8_9RHOB|nr:hypothetical protein [Palleronia pontilimi]MBJ3762108.1 hypothetical protein [Palleronia pontilimi]
MSFDIAFWRYSDTLEHDHAAVHSALANGNKLDGLAELDTNAMIETLAELLSAWERIDEQRWERPKQYLEAWAYPQYLSINMSFGAARPVLLKITTPMRRFGCGLWNPQTNQRLPGYEEAGAKGEK